MTRILAVVLSLTLVGTAWANDEGPWTAKAGLGYLATSGNSETTNVNGSFDLGYKIARWNHTLGFLAIGAETQGISTAERYVLGYKSTWDFRDFDYFFGGLDYDKDKFSGVEQSLSQTIGYGRRFINNDVQKLNGEIGVGFRQQDFVDGTDDSSAIIKIGGDYLYNISDTSAFTQTLDFEIGSDNTTTISVTGLSMKVRDSLALLLGYTIKNNSDVPVGVDKTDTFSSINLEYTF